MGYARVNLVHTKEQLLFAIPFIYRYRWFFEILWFFDIFFVWIPFCFKKCPVEINLYSLLWFRLITDKVPKFRSHVNVSGGVNQTKPCFLYFSLISFTPPIVLKIIIIKMWIHSWIPLVTSILHYHPCPRPHEDDTKKILTREKIIIKFGTGIREWFPNVYFFFLFTYKICANCVLSES